MYFIKDVFLVFIQFFLLYISSYHISLCFTKITFIISTLFLLFLHYIICVSLILPHACKMAKFFAPAGYFIFLFIIGKLKTYWNASSIPHELLSLDIPQRQLPLILEILLRKHQLQFFIHPLLMIYSISSSVPIIHISLLPWREMGLWWI